MRSMSFSGWLVAATCVGLCHCALDDRSPTEVMASNQPAAGGASSAPSSAGAGPGSSEAGGNVGSSSSSGVAGGADTAGSAGVARGMRPGSGGASNVGDMTNTGGTSSMGGATAGAADTSGAGTSGADTSGAGATGMEGGLMPIDLGGVSAPVLNTATCPAFTPCGGSLVGSWVYTDACPTTAMTAFPGCTPSVEYEAGAAAALSFSESQAQRTGAPVGDGIVTFPAECGLSCDLVQALAAGAGQCSEAAAACACRTPFSIDWSLQAYTTSGTQLTLADGRTFEYCVDADRLIYRETGDAKEPGVFTLRRN